MKINDLEQKRVKKNEWAKKAAVYAQQAVLYEAVVYPKPGLVDPLNSGSHRDMDLFTFIDSSTRLYEGFKQFALLGLNWQDTPKKLFQAVRPIGIETEKAMLSETGGVNTHKGMIFSMGLFLSAAGFMLQNNVPLNADFPVFCKRDSDQLFDCIREMTAGLISKDFKDLHGKRYLTNGETLFLRYGFTGIRGEAESGYPILQQKSLPLLRNQKKTRGVNDRLTEILTLLMSVVEDSTVVHRGGIEGLEMVRNEARKQFLASSVDQSVPKREPLDLAELNTLFVKHNISPGGSADLLSVTIFLGKLENII